MAITKVIRGGEGDDFSRWELPEVEGQQKARQAPAKPPGLPTVEEIEALQKQAYEEGFTQGRNDGLAQGREEGLKLGRQEGEQQGQALAVRIRGILDSLAEPAAELDDAVEQQLLQLCLVLSQQIIRRELQTQPGEILACVREAVALLPLSARDVKVHVHPEDARFLRENMGASDADPAWKLIDDPAITRGGCRVTTPSSRIDATLERRLAVLASELLGGVRDEDGKEEA